MSKVALPPLSAIKDPSIRASLQAIYTALGSANSTDTRYITVKEMTDALSGAVNSEPSGVIGAELRKSLEILLNMRVVKLIDSRINGPVANMITDQLGAAIQHTENQRVQGETVIAERIDNLVAQTNNVRIDAEEALTVSAALDGTVSGSWTVKFDADGYVVGVGLGLEGKDGVYESAFVVQADRFVVKIPGGSTEVVPFLVDASGVYINGSLRVGGGTTTVDDLTAGFDSITINTSSDIFKVDGGGAASPTSVTFSVGLTGSLTGLTPTYSVTSGTATLTGSTLTYANMTTDAVTVRATVTGGYYDEVTIAKLRDGSNSVVAVLGNPSHPLPTTSGGTVTYTGSGTTIKVYEGATLRTITACTRTGTSVTPGAVSGTGTTTVTIADHSSITADTASVLYSLTATRGDGTSVDTTVTQTMFKAKAGTNGSPGTNGTRTAYLYFYQWNTTQPTTFPSGTSNYNWTTGTYGAPTTQPVVPWTVEPGTPVAGETLWRCVMPYSDTLTSSPTNVGLSITSCVAVGKAGGNGSRGSLTLYTTSPIADQAAAESAFSAVFPTEQRRGDEVVYQGTTSSASYTWYRTADGAATWSKPALYVNGDAIINGTLAAEKLTTGTLSATATITVGTATNGVIIDGPNSRLKGVKSGSTAFQLDPSGLLLNPKQASIQNFGGVTGSKTLLEGGTSLSTAGTVTAWVFVEDLASASHGGGGSCVYEAFVTGYYMNTSASPKVKGIHKHMMLGVHSPNQTYTTIAGYGSATVMASATADATNLPVSKIDLIVDPTGALSGGAAGLYLKLVSYTAQTSPGFTWYKYAVRVVDDLSTSWSTWG